MKAIVLRERGGPDVLEVEEWPEPVAGSGEVVVALRAAAVNHRDVWLRSGATGQSVIEPAVPGSDGSGEVVALGDHVDPAWKGADSIKLLEGATAQLRHSGYRVVNVDATVIAQRPKLVPYLDAMRANLARALGVSAEQVSVKGKTNEGVDSAARGEAMACHAVALVARASIDD